jgi:hypothetical protein
MSRGHDAAEWVQENLPQLEARGPKVVASVIERAIRDTRVRRFWTVLVVILLPATAVNVYHAEIIELTGGAISRAALLAISIVVTAMVASRWSAQILHARIETLARSGPGLAEP